MSGPTHDSRTNTQDLLLLDRFLDGALAESEAQACRRRLEGEPALRRTLQQRQALRRGFAAGRAEAFAPPAAFAASVLAAARRLPAPADRDSSRDIATLCRRILVVAAAVITAAVLWQSGLLRGAGDGTLQAAPGEVRQVLEELDAGIRAQAGRAEGR